MEKSTIKIEMTNLEIGEITEIQFSTDNIKEFLKMQEKLLEMFYENNKKRN